ISGEEHNYYVVAKVKSGTSTDGTTQWADAIELVDKTGGITVNGDTVLCAKTFTTGDNRTPVQVTLNGAPFTYDGKEHGVLDDGSNNGELSIQVAGTNNNFAASNFTVKYHKYDAGDANHLGELLSGAPKDAGKYVIAIQLTALAEEDYYTTAQFIEFEIKPFQLDMSQVKWGYLDADGNEVEYDPTKPLQYEKDAEGNVVEHELILIGLPKGDEEGDDDAKLLAQMFAESTLGSGLLTYSGNKEGAVGTYNAECAFGALSGNFAFANLPAFIQVDGDNNPTNAQQSWKVDPKKVNTPKSDNTHTFTGEVLDILSFAGMDPEGLGLYYTLTGLTKRDENNEAQSLFSNSNPTIEEIKEVLAGIKDAGRYGISVALIDAPNTEFNENGAKGTLPVYSAQITVNKLKVTVSGWQGDGNSPWQVSADPAGILENHFVAEDGTVVSTGELINHMNEQFKQTVVPSAGNEDNIEIEYAEGVDEEKTFIMLDLSNPPDPINKPTANETTSVVYDGAAHSFLPNGLEQLITRKAVKLYAVDGEGNETEVDKEYFTQVKAGSYKVIVKISGNYYWDGTNNDKTPIEFTFEIEKLKL
ncbi:MAG: hypothetical protein K2L87_04395, partial [Clostridiales bacterium]|nr:hypothetical protein [Clostridiales bacterium]